MLRRLTLLLLAFSAFAIAQKQPAEPLPTIRPSTHAVTAADKEYVSLNFGTSFTFIEKFPVMTGDMDGDGTEDAVFVLTRKDNPLLDEEEFNYKVIDPYDEYFGWGDPKVTSKFNAHDPDAVKYIAIVHNWRAATPKAKYVVINLPFEKLSITRIPVKKKKLAAISAEDLGGITSAIYWDGKKYKWDAMSAE